MGDKLDKEFGSCTTVKMLTGLRDLKALLALREDETLNLKATFRDIVNRKSTVCIWQKKSRG